jgi:hypothetical protein
MGARMVTREEVAVTDLPLVLRVERGSQAGALRLLVRSFDPIPVPPSGRLILRSQGHGVVIERETG